MPPSCLSDARRHRCLVARIRRYERTNGYGNALSDLLPHPIDVGSHATQSEISRCLALLKVWNRGADTSLRFRLAALVKLR